MLRCHIPGYNVSLDQQPTSGTEALLLIHMFRRRYAFLFTNDIIVHHGAEITAAFILVSLICSDLEYFFDILLLVAIFSLLFHLYQQSNSRTRTAVELFYGCITLSASYSPHFLSPFWA